MCTGTGPRVQQKQRRWDRSRRWTRMRTGMNILNSQWSFVISRWTDGMSTDAKLLASVSQRQYVRTAKSEATDAEHEASLDNLKGVGMWPAGLPISLDTSAPLFNFVSDATRANGKSTEVDLNGRTYHMPLTTDSLKGLVGKLKVGSFSADLDENVARLSEIPSHFAGEYKAMSDENHLDRWGTLWHRIHVQNQRVVISEHSRLGIAATDDCLSVKTYHVANGGVRSAVADEDILVLCEAPGAGEGDVKEARLRGDYLKSANSQMFMSFLLGQMGVVNVQERVAEFIAALDTVTSDPTITGAPEKQLSPHMAALQKGLMMSDQTVLILVFDHHAKTCTMHQFDNVIDDLTYSTMLQSAVKSLIGQEVKFTDPMCHEPAEKYQTVRTALPVVCKKGDVSEASEADNVAFSRLLAGIDKVELAMRRKQAAENVRSTIAQFGPADGANALVQQLNVELAAHDLSDLALLQSHNTALGKQAPSPPTLPVNKRRTWWDLYKYNVEMFTTFVLGPAHTLGQGRIARIEASTALGHALPVDPNTGESSSGEVMFPGASAVSAAGKNLTVMQIYEKIVCFDTDTKAVVWEKPRETLFSASLTQTRLDHIAAHPLADLLAGMGGLISMRSPPQIVQERNMVILCANGYGCPFVGGFDLDTGATIFEIDADPDNAGPGFGNPWDPAAPVNKAFTGLRITPVFATEDGVDYLYCSLARGIEYYIKNFFSQEDQSKPGFLSFCGEIAKVKVNADGSSERVWTCPTMPEEILGTPGEKVPSGCLRPGMSHVIATAQLEVDMPLSGVAGATIGAADRKVYVPSLYGDDSDVRQDIGWVVDLSTTATLEAATAYSATLFDRADSSAYVDADVGVLVRTFTGAQLAGQTGVFDDSSGTPVEVVARVTMQVEVTPDFEFVDSAWSKSIAYSLNYYGANAWQIGAVLSEDHFTVGVGNATKQPVDESIALDAVNTNMQALNARLAADEITLDQYKQLAFQEQTDLLSPRGKRAMLSSLFTVNRATGAPHQRVSSTMWDAWNLADWGGLGFFFGAPSNFGQPLNKPYIVPFGPDADATGPVAMNDGYIGAGTKGGLAIITKVACMPQATPLVEGDVMMVKGCATMSSPPDTKKLVVGFAGFLGGVNYGVATDGERLFCNLSNNSDPFPLYLGGVNPGDLPGWKLKDGTEITTGQTYAVAVDTAGELVWDALTSRSGSCVPSVHKGGVLVSSGGGARVFDAKTGAEIAQLTNASKSPGTKCPPTIGANDVALCYYDDADGIVAWDMSI